MGGIIITSNDFYVEGKQRDRPMKIIYTFLDLYVMFSGNLEKVIQALDVCFLDFAGGYRLILKDCSAEFVTQLQQHRGEKIGIMRTNIPGFEYIIRRMTSKHHYDTTKKRNILTPIRSDTKKTSLGPTAISETWL